jgi:hypothetical protein
MQKPDEGTSLLLGTLIGTTGLFVLSLVGIFPWSLTAALLSVILVVLVISFEHFPKYMLAAMIIAVPIVWCLAQPDSSRERVVAYFWQSVEHLIRF